MFMLCSKTNSLCDTNEAPHEAQREAWLTLVFSTVNYAKTFFFLIDIEE